MPPPFEAADLPPKAHGFWQLVGPGAVLVGLSIGAGELIVWPRNTAQFGAGMTWAAVLGIFLQLWINCEIGRYTLATGESIYTGFSRLSHHFAWLFLLLNVAGWILPGWARTCGGALKVLLVGPQGWGEPWMWTAVTFAGVASVLFGPKLVYASVEHTTEALVVTVTLGLLVLVSSVGDLATWAELGQGILSLPYKHPQMPTYELFSSIVFAGAGGTANLFYSFYIRDKGWGMGLHMPKVLNPLRAREEAVSDKAFRVVESRENLQRWRAWFRHLCLDQVLFFWLLNTFTILLFIFAALAVLHPQGIVPNQEFLIWEEASILGNLWGSFGTVLFLLVGIACLFSTQLTLVDGVARSFADILHTNYAWAQKKPLSWWYGTIAVAWMVLGTALTYVYESLPPILFLLGSAFFGGIAMAVYTPLTLILNRKFLPQPIRPGVAHTVLLAAISAFYILFAIFSVVMLSQMVFAS
jgi:hypothetical protein